jgi:hypothetical protein
MIMIYYETEKNVKKKKMYINFFYDYFRNKKK